MRKNKKFEWTKQCQDSFDQLVNAMITAPVLAFPQVEDPHSSYEVTLDGSQFAYGATLSQVINGERRVVAYFSRKIQEHKRVWPQTQLEFETLYQTLKYWSIYLRGCRNFSIVTDCRPLLNITTIFSKMSSNIIRKLQFLANFRFTIRHISGAENHMADMLSRYQYGNYKSSKRPTGDTTNCTYRVACIQPMDHDQARELRRDVDHVISRHYQRNHPRLFDQLNSPNPEKLSGLDQEPQVETVDLGPNSELQIGTVDSNNSLGPNSELQVGTIDSNNSLGPNYELQLGTIDSNNSLGPNSELLVGVVEPSHNHILDNEGGARQGNPGENHLDYMGEDTIVPNYLFHNNPDEICSITIVHTPIVMPETPCFCDIPSAVEFTGPIRECKVSAITSHHIPDLYENVGVPSKEELQKAQESDDILREVRNWVHECRKPRAVQANRTPVELLSYWRQFDLLKIENGLLMRKWVDARMLLKPDF